jgi:hypothetical protein
MRRASGAAQRVLRVLGQARVVDPATAGATCRNSATRQRIAAMALHAQRQRFHALQDLPGAIGDSAAPYTRSVSMRARIVKPKSPKVS